MNITSIKFTNQEHTFINIVTEDGQEMTGAYPNSTWIAQHIEEWIAKGNTITAYTVPPVTADQVRAQRNTLLSQCDWTVLANAPLSLTKKNEWVTYRQALRDITVQVGFPDNVVWPVAPSTE